MSNLTEEMLVEALTEIRTLADAALKKVSIKPTRVSPNADHTSLLRANLSPVAVMGWGMTPDNFPLNALAWDNDGEEPSPVHLDDNGVQRDRRGIAISQYAHAKVFGTSYIQKWMKERNMVAL